MYTTKLFNPKVASSYLNIGDPYQKPSQVDSRYKAKQFQTNPSKKGQLDGYFSKSSHQADSYNDSNGYRETQPRDKRKLGFGSLDAHRRDEFTLDIRAQQYRELLTKEKEFQRSVLEQKAAARSQSAPAATADAIDTLAATQLQQQQRDPAYFQTMVPDNLYDIGKEPWGITPTCNKCSRETFYCAHRAHLHGEHSLRRPGGHITSSSEVGSQVRQMQKPEFSKRSSLKDFYDNNHLVVGKLRN